MTTLTQSIFATNSIKLLSLPFTPRLFAKSLLAVCHPRIRCARTPSLSFSGDGTVDCSALEFTSAGMEHKQVSFLAHTFIQLLG